MITWIEGAIVAVVLLILAAVAVPAVTRVRAQRICLEHGFPEVKIALGLTAYCVKRVNQTDSVVPLAKVP